MEYIYAGSVSEKLLLKSALKNIVNMSDEYLSTQISVGELNWLEETALDGIYEKMDNIENYIINMREYIDKAHEEGFDIFKNDLMSRVGYIVDTFRALSNPRVEKMLQKKPFFVGKCAKSLDEIKNDYRTTIEMISNKNILDEIKRIEMELGKWATILLLMR